MLSPLKWRPHVPAPIRAAVEESNAAFVTAFKQSEEAKVHTANAGRERQQFLLDAHKRMWLDPDEQVRIGWGQGSRRSKQFGSLLTRHFLFCHNFKGMCAK